MVASFTPEHGHRGVDTFTPTELPAPLPPVDPARSPAPSVTAQRNATRAKTRRERRAEAKAFLIEIDGRQVSHHPDVVHGGTEGYDLFSCRCAECTAAVSLRHERRMKDLAQYRLRVLEELLTSTPGVNPGLVRPNILKNLLAFWSTARGQSRQRLLVDHLAIVFPHPGPEPGQAEDLAQRLQAVLADSRREFRAQGKG